MREDKQQDQRRRADRAGDRSSGCDQCVDIEGAGYVVEQHRAKQEERRSQHRGHDIFEGSGQRRGRPAKAEEAVSGDRYDLEEDELIEQVAGHHHAIDAHGQDKIEQQSCIASAQAPPKGARPKQGCDIDAGGEELLPTNQSEG